MVMLKVCRLGHKYHKDGCVDVAGYIGKLGEVMEAGGFPTGGDAEPKKENCNSSQRFPEAAWSIKLAESLGDERNYPHRTTNDLKTWQYGPVSIIYDCYCNDAGWVHIFHTNKDYTGTGLPEPPTPEEQERILAEIKKHKEG